MTPAAIEAVNEFVIRFANINGTGSASANGMVAKSFFRLGLPIGPKNMFPSNIQGMPTWYEVRVSARGFTGRRGGVDIVVAMNPQTFSKDAQALDPGGYLIYDSTRAVREDQKRPDIHYLGIPITALTRDSFPNPKSRAMLKNMVYVGALAALLGIDLEVYKDLVREQFANKPNLHNNNFQALELGFHYAQQFFHCPFGIRVEPLDLVKGKIIVDGNQAAALGCVYAGATVAAWYPITPSTSVIDHFSKFCRQFRRDEGGKLKAAILQAEDEIAAAGMVLGANWNGARAFTATSGPGISLMNEFIGYAYYAEIPAVIFNIQRCGPSTGMPTRTQQADVLLCAYASHGDTKHIMLMPSTPKECFEMGALAFDLADRFHTVVFVMSDLELGMNEYVTDEFTWDKDRTWDRGEVWGPREFEAGKKFYRYVDESEDGVLARTYPGVDPRGAYFTRGSGHDRFGRYTEDGALYMENMRRIERKFKTATTFLPKPEIEFRSQSRRFGVISFGTTWEPMREALAIMEARGIALNHMRLRSFPFGDEVRAFIQAHDQVIVVEQNRDAQMRQVLAQELELNYASLLSVRAWDGLPVMARWLVEEISKLVVVDT